MLAYRSSARNLSRVVGRTGSSLRKMVQSENPIVNRISRSYASSKRSLQVIDMPHREPRPETFTVIPQIIENSKVEFAERLAMGERNGDKFDWITYAEFGDMVDNFRRVLHEHKIGRGDKVALISNNRIEWAVAMYAVTGVGGQLVPMYEAQLESDWKYIIEDSDAKMCLVATDNIYDKVSTYVGKVGHLNSVLCFNADKSKMNSYKKWMHIAKDLPDVPVASIKPSEISTIIYTSGTTGKPKGVELSHENVVANLRGLDVRWQNKMEQMTSLAFLPWSHVFGQTTELHTFLAIGSCMGIVSKREEILEAIPMIKPTVIVSVPVLFNKVYDGVLKKVNEGSPIAKKVFFGALAIARERNHLLEFQQEPSAWLNFKFNLADKIVFSKIRERLGGRLQFFCAGGAATSLTVLQFFEDIGVPICEGYGLTETSPVMTCGSNDWETRRLGCVGVPLHNNVVRIIDPHTLEERPFGEEGEIVQAGPNIMTGYRNNDAANEEVFFQKDGMRFFRTGDLGRIIDRKFLKITGRIKEQFKLENGKYVVPAPLEDAITRSQFIAQCFMHGDNKPHTSILVIPDPIEMPIWAEKNGLGGIPMDMLIKETKVIEFLNSEIVAACQVLKAYERPKKWLPLATPFSPDNQMLTAKMSMRRNNILATYGDMVMSMYDDAGHNIH